MKKFNLKEHIAKNKATFYSSINEGKAAYEYEKGKKAGEDIEKKDMKESKLRSKIKEMILAELAESNIDINDTTNEYDFLAEYEASLNEEDEDEEVEVEDTEETDDTEEEIEIDTDEVDPTIKAIQDALAQAQGAAQKLGDEKLTDQIGNTITFFTRAHISKPQQDNLMENKKTLFPMLNKILK
jgi:hypothetical protein